MHARGAAAAAAELAELAVRLTPAEDVDDVRRRVLDCADRLREAGDGDRAIALLEQARDDGASGAGAGRGPRAPGPTRWRMVVGPREAVDLYREALAEAEGDAALEAEIHLNLAGLSCTESETAAWRTPSWPSRLRHAPGTPRSGAGRWRRSGSCTSAAGEAFRASRWRRRSRSSGRCRRGR